MEASKHGSSARHPQDSAVISTNQKPVGCVFAASGEWFQATCLFAASAGLRGHFSVGEFPFLGGYT
jgi:hypothetical protein